MKTPIDNLVIISGLPDIWIVLDLKSKIIRIKHSRTNLTKVIHPAHHTIYPLEGIAAPVKDDKPYDFVKLKEVYEETADHKKFIQDFDKLFPGYDKDSFKIRDIKRAAKGLRAFIELRRKEKEKDGIREHN